MLMPSLFGENLLDDVFGFHLNEQRMESMMKTDVKEEANHYEIAMNLPGVQKENIHAELQNGYLTITATTSQDIQEEHEETQYIRRERYNGSCSRSFYVGDQVTEEEIKAKYEDGVLHITVPKKGVVEEFPVRNRISIEG